MYSFSSSVLLALAAASSVLAQTTGFDTFTNPSSAKPGVTVAASDPFKITWDPSPAPLNGKISIFLLQGATNTSLQLGNAIATGLDASTGTYSWNIQSDTPVYDTYGFKLSLDSAPTTFQFSTYFHISGLGGGSSTSNSTVTSTTATTGTASASKGSITSTASGYSNSSKTTTTISTSKTASTSSIAPQSTTKTSTTGTTANAAATMGAGLMGAVAVVVGLML